MIRERQREGIAIAKDKDVYRLTYEQVATARSLPAARVPKVKMARDLACSLWVLYDALSATGGYAMLLVVRLRLSCR